MHFKIITFIVYLLFNYSVKGKESKVIKLLKNEYLIDYRSFVFDQSITQIWIYKIKNNEQYNKSYFKVNEFSQRESILKMFNESSLSSVLKNRGLKTWLFYIPPNHKDIDSTYIQLNTITGSSYIYIHRMTDVHKKMPKLITSDLNKFYINK